MLTASTNRSVSPIYAAQTSASSTQISTHGVRALLLLGMSLQLRTIPVTASTRRTIAIQSGITSTSLRLTDVASQRRQ